MSDYLTTINHDLQGLKKLMLEGSSTPNFYCGPVFSLFRDACIILYEANKILKVDGVIYSDLQYIEIIEEVRHKVKTNQGIKNREIFNKLLAGHKSLFGEDIDNLGFYLDDDVLASSTLFHTFVYADTPLQSTLDGEAFRNFSIVIGSLMADITDIINQPVNLSSKPIDVSNEEDYLLKDVWDQRFFTKDVKRNVFFTRLLLIQNELTTSIWLKNHIGDHSSEFNFNKYILLRFTSTKLYETMRNLMNIKDILSQYWSNSELRALDDLLVEYKDNHENEMKTLRNMIHYSNKKVNFYDYIQQQISEDECYPDKQINIIFNDYIHKIRNAISATVDIQSYQSMSDSEMIERRIQSRFYQDE